MFGGGPEAVAKTILGALESDRPRSAMSGHPQRASDDQPARFVPDRLWDLMMRAQFPTPQA